MKTHINYISIHYNRESISLPVIHNGVALEYMPELKDYLQDIIDDFPRHFKQTYYMVSHQILMRHSGYTTHITIFNLRDSHKPAPLSGATKNKIIKLIYDPTFSGLVLPQIIQTDNSVTIINCGEG